MYTQTETAIWNDIPDKLRYNYYSEKDGSINGEKEGVGLRDGPYEASDDSSVKERKKNEERARKLEKMKDERNITTEELSKLNNEIQLANEEDKLHDKAVLGTNQKSKGIQVETIAPSDEPS